MRNFEVTARAQCGVRSVLPQWCCCCCQLLLTLWLWLPVALSFALEDVQEWLNCQLGPHWSPVKKVGRS